MISPVTGFAATPILSGLMASSQSATILRMSGWSPQNAGDVPSSWGEPLAHTRDPAPTQLDPNDPKSKQTHIPKSESFEEYLARRNGGAAAAPAAAAPAYSPPAQSYQPPAQSYSPPAPAYSPPAQPYSPPAPAYSPPATSYSPPAAAAPTGGAWSPQNAGDVPDGGWGGEAKAHTRDPTPTQLDPNDPKSKQTHIPQGDSFEEYMRRRQQ
eukprot:CAMPEP_0181311194 /NCGR_PEP_ID=MMETSP1101-20121128/13002_1 /TAXON_ID=46948 /ORGANISM="Rhodomonas abbreviata, Strain Caron Lab Isolate" /LENGTH=210 /DNA_ID=CAMNT_0023417899 /DNA_START=28 /DNA_END=660 /DNA_ORIENTATION=+